MIGGAEASGAFGDVEASALCGARGVVAKLGLLDARRANSEEQGHRALVCAEPSRMHPDVALMNAIKAAIDAGLYERARALLEILSQ